MSKYEGYCVGEWLSARKKPSTKLDWGVGSFFSRAIWVSSMMLLFLKVAAMIRRLADREALLWNQSTFLVGIFFV
jgi:hypothetical protein